MKNEVKSHIDHFAQYAAPKKATQNEQKKRITSDGSHVNLHA